MMQDGTNKFITQFKKTIEKMIDDGIKKKRITTYVTAIVTQDNGNGTVDVYFPPDTNSLKQGILNKTGEDLKAGDAVEVCTKNGSMANAWVSIKHGPTINSGGGGGGGGGTTEGDTLPIGAIMAWPTDEIPDNFVEANGQNLSQTLYSELYQVYGDYYNTDSTPDGYFGVPNLNSRVPVGFDSSDTQFNTLGNTGGEKTHTLTANELAAHRHGFQGGSALFTQPDQGVKGLGPGNLWIEGVGAIPTTSTDGGANQPHNNMQPYIVQKYIIKAKPGNSTSLASVAVGETTTLEPGADATVTNVGTAKDLILDFGIPQGEMGSPGETEPIGTIKMYGGTTAPDGYMFANGQAISRTTYSDLFAIYGTTFGAGDGSTTFNLPNLNGRTPVGLNASDSNFNTIGKTGGEKTHTLTKTELPNVQLSVFGSGTTDGNDILKFSSVGVSTMTAGPRIGVTEPMGSNQPHNNMQPYMVLNYIVKVIQYTPIQGVIENSMDSNSTTDAPSIAAVKNYILNFIHPVGSIYMSVNDTNPGDVFGGTWEQWGSGRVPVGVDTSQTEFKTVEKTGGEKTHTMTIGQLPNHDHKYLGGAAIVTRPDGGVKGVASGGNWVEGLLSIPTTSSAGSSEPFNILQPYITCYMWKRTA